MSEPLYEGDCCKCKCTYNRDDFHTVIITDDDDGYTEKYKLCGNCCRAMFYRLYPYNV